MRRLRAPLAPRDAETGEAEAEQGQGRGLGDLSDVLFGRLDLGIPSEEVHLTSVITPLDGSVLAEQILPHVVALAKALGLTVVLVRIAPENRERSRDYLQEVRDELYQQGVFSAEVQVLGGHPAEAIVDLAQETSNNLVAMTTHGRSGMDRWLLGSVTDRVVRHSGGPVLVIRAAPGLH